MPESKTIEVTREYYDSDSADQFYATVWGGEDILRSHQSVSRSHASADVGRTI